MPDEQGQYKYIDISWAGASESGKTNIYVVTNKRGGDRLGIIRWFGHWRQYTFFPSEGTTFSDGCLRDIADFIPKGAER